MATSSAIQLADLALTWSNALGSADLSIIDMDLASDRGLVTAMLLSLFTDRRAEDDDEPPSGDPADRRGWWADQFAAVEGDKFGSRLWLLDRSKSTNETVLRAEEYVREAWAWLLEDRVAASIDVAVEASGNGLVIAGAVQRPSGDRVSFRFAHAWDGLQAPTKVAAPVGVAPNALPGVTQDATRGVYVPSTAAEWTTVLAAAAIASGNPTHAWLHAVASSPMPDVIGADNMTEAAGGIQYQQSKAGWSRVGTVFLDAGTATLLTAATYNSSTLFLAYVGLTGTPGASRSVLYAQGEVGIETTRIYSGDTNTGAADAGTTVRPVIIKVDRTGAVKRIYTDQEVIAQTYGSATNVVGFGNVIQTAAPMWVGYSALFTGAAAELSDSQIRTLLQTLGWSVAW